MADLPTSKDNPPVTTEPSFLSWHYGVAVGEFAKSRLASIGNTLQFFNVAKLFANLFSPYRRMSVGKKETAFGAKTLFDKITFNLTSIFVGFAVRIILIFVGLGAAVFMAIYDLFAIPMYIAIPLFSYPKYAKIIASTFYEKDLEDPNVFLKKLIKTSLLQKLARFFDEDFLKILSALPLPSALGITASQKPQEMVKTIAKNYEALNKYLQTKNIKSNQFEMLVDYLAQGETPKKAVTPIGQMLAFGYTNTLDKFCTELTDQTLAPPTKLEFLKQLTKILTRSQNNNVLLVGEPGVGRHTTLINLASAIQRFELPGLESRRVMMLDTIALAGTGASLIEVKSNFEAILEEAKRAGNIILAIDQVDRIASAQDQRTDLSEVLTTILRDNSLPIVGITNPDDYNRYIRTNGNFAKLFEKIDVAESTIEETVVILAGKSLDLVVKENVVIYFDAIWEIAQKSSRLVIDRKQPEKSIILLGDCVAEAKSRKTNVVSVGLVDEVISAKTKTPLGAITAFEAQKLKDLEAILHKRIVGQDEAIIEIAKAMRRARAEIENTNRPIGSFLFLGPTGVGKTETAKALAEVYFGNEEKMVRLDMTEFQGADSLKRLLGDPDMRSPGQLATMIRENPYGLLLVDEFEKASKDVHNLFLQILDEGFLTDAFGKKVSFDNVIIIATSNAGAEFIREYLSTPKPPVPQQESPLSKLLVDHILKKGLFAPELVNRFDGVVVYHPLNPAQVVGISQMMLERLSKELKSTKNVTLEITPEIAQKVASLGFDPAFGARPIRRLIQDKIEDGIAKMIIDGTAKSGTTIPAQILFKFLS